MVKIGINGFGRIGRFVAKIAAKNPNVTLVGVNDPFLTADYMAYLIQYDTAQKRFEADLSYDVEADTLTIDGQVVKCFHERDPKEINWASVGAEIVVESTGIFLNVDQANAHLGETVKKVVVSAPSKTAPMFVMGVNHMDLTPEHNIVSNASCTTNCLAPLVKIIDKEFGIVEGLMSTIHAVTATQAQVDAPSKKNWRLGRAGCFNIIPTSTGAAVAVGKVYPSILGKLTGMAFRVPVLTGSVVDLTVKLAKETTYEEICAKVKEYSEGELKGIMGYTDLPNVSADFIGDSRSSIFDAKAGIMLNPTFVKLISWYDNEAGYSNRVIDLCIELSKYF
eukprot:TRINITY_DN3101_c1_g5_i3.p1 TRINITY_DN3101_c1_g5~~TRINITY_DN3101_c1_g5_i3.p1  ORF type:complete len:336 (-),score=75.30 TRINITY_DN3101_c1_g5_i3:75-1082(-)